jgi:hypothetical protein
MYLNVSLQIANKLGILNKRNLHSHCYNNFRFNKDKGTSNGPPENQYGLEQAVENTTQKRFLLSDKINEGGGEVHGLEFLLLLNTKKNCQQRMFAILGTSPHFVTLQHSVSNQPPL